MSARMEVRALIFAFIPYATGVGRAAPAPVPCAVRLSPGVPRS